MKQFIKFGNSWLHTYLPLIFVSQDRHRERVSVKKVESMVSGHYFDLNLSKVDLNKNSCYCFWLIAARFNETTCKYFCTDVERALERNFSFWRISLRLISTSMYNILLLIELYIKCTCIFNQLKCQKQTKFKLSQSLMTLFKVIA